MHVPCSGWCREPPGRGPSTSVCSSGYRHTGGFRLPSPASGQRGAARASGPAGWRAPGRGWRPFPTPPVTGRRSPGPRVWPGAGPAEGPGARKARHAPHHRSAPAARPVGATVRGPGAAFGHGGPCDNAEPSAGPETQQALPPAPLPPELPRPPLHSRLTPDSQNTWSQAETATPDPRIPSGPRAPPPRVRAPPRGGAGGPGPLGQSGCGGCEPAAPLCGSLPPLLFPPLARLLPPPLPALPPFQPGPAGAARSGRGIELLGR